MIWLRKRVHLDVTAQLVAEFAALFLVLHRLEAIHRRLQMALHVGVVGGVLLARRLVEDLGEGLDLAPVVDLQPDPARA